MESVENTVLDSIGRHASVRRYIDRDVPDQLVERIVGAGQRAATSSNLQMTTAIVVRNRERRERLALLCGDQRQIREAPVFIAWCADRSRLDRVCATGGYAQNTEYLESFLVAAVDVAIFMQTAVIAAEAMGLGTCYIGAIRNDAAAISEILQLPRRVVPIAGLTLGYPDGVAEPRPRLPLSAVLHHDVYTRNDEAILRTYDREMAATGIYAGRHEATTDSMRIPGAQLRSEDDYGWLEHSARRASRPNRLDLGTVVRESGYSLR